MTAENKIKQIPDYEGTRTQNEKHKKEVLGSSNRGNKNPNFKRGKGLLYPTHEQTMRLVELGIPRWAIRLDWLGVMLSTYVNGCFCSVDQWMQQGRIIISGTQAECYADRLIYILENNLITAEEVNQRLLNS